MNDPQTDLDRDLMDPALAAAREALSRNDMPIGCAIYIDGRLASTGSNSVNSSSDDTKHAEMVALQAIAPELFNAKRTASVCLYTTMEPCAMCFGAIAHFRIDRVVYAMSDPHAGVTTQLHNDRYYGTRGTEWIGGVCESKAQSMIDEYVDTTGRRAHLHSRNRHAAPVRCL